MEYTALGSTGLRISRLGFGGIPIQRTDAAQAAALLEEVRAGGINYIDTARGYTVSEELIGRSIEGHRKDFILATKSMARDRTAMAADIETSLRSLRTDYIDLYQVHNPTLPQLEQVCGEGGALEALLEAKAAGKLGHLGLTAHSLEVFERGLELDWVETIMFPYNAVENQGETLIQKAHEKGVGVICMKPLAGGAIEDAALAIRFAFSNPNISVVIPGMYHPDEVRQNIAAAEIQTPLSAEDLEKLDRIREELGSNFCRRCNYCAPCTAGISIPNVFLFHGYLRRYGLEAWARDRYQALPVKAKECVECGVCEERCPYQLPIREMLKRAAADFGQ